MGTSKMRLLVFGLVAAFFLGLGPALWGQTDHSDYYTTISQQEAIGIALAVTGLESSPQLQVSAQSEMVSTAQLWRVTFQNGPLVFFRSPEDGSSLKTGGPHYTQGGIIRSNPRIARLDVIIDAATGQLLKITSPLPNDADPRIAAAAVQRGIDSALYHSRLLIEGVSRESPRIPFCEALQYMAERGDPFVIRGAQVEATCLDVRDDEEGHRAFVQRRRRFFAPNDPEEPTPLPTLAASGGRGTVWLVVFQYLSRECALDAPDLPQSTRGAPADRPVLPRPSNLVPNPVLRSWTLIDVASGRSVGGDLSPAYVDVNEVAREFCR